MDLMVLATTLFASHLAVDFYLQPLHWVKAKEHYKEKAWQLYVHALLAGVLAWLAVQLVTKGNYWIIAGVALPHFFIDLWKLRTTKKIAHFMIDQVLHLLTLGIVFLMVIQNKNFMHEFMTEPIVIKVGVIIVAILFLWLPSGIIIGKLTEHFRDNLNQKDRDKALPNAGKWIGILERLFIFIAIMAGQFSAIGFLIAAKSILRFTDSRSVENPIRMSEYVLIGSLISFLFAIVTALICRYILTLI